MGRKPVLGIKNPVGTVVDWALGADVRPDYAGALSCSWVAGFSAGSRAGRLGECLANSFENIRAVSNRAGMSCQYALAVVHQGNGLR